jgi:hypothetical protein
MGQLEIKKGDSGLAIYAPRASSRNTFMMHSREIVQFACKAIERLLHHLSDNPAYARYPYYSALLIAMVIAWGYWPISGREIERCFEDPYWWIFNATGFDVGPALALAMGLIGLTRSGVRNRLIAGAGVVASLWFLETWRNTMFLLHLEFLWSDFKWWTWDVPTSLLYELLWENSVLAWTVYFGLAYLVLRVLATRLVLPQAIPRLRVHAVSLGRSLAGSRLLARFRPKMS